jgi:hypothetical protein
MAKAFPEWLARLPHANSQVQSGSMKASSQYLKLDLPN